MVATTVQAGLSLNAAMAYAVDSTTGTLATEMREALSEIRLGRSRQEALQAMADRLNQPELSTMVSAILQCERLGSNIGAVLTELADDTRKNQEDAYRLAQQRYQQGAISGLDLAQAQTTVEAAQMEWRRMRAALDSLR